MDITLHSAAISASETQLNDAASSQVDLPSAQQWQDINQDGYAFEQAMKSQNVESVNDGKASSLSEDILNRMHSLSASASEKGEMLEQQIMKASDSMNPMDLVKANRLMSEYYLENLMTAKLVGNATQAIERLTNLS